MLGAYRLSGAIKAPIKLYSKFKCQGNAKSQFFEYLGYNKDYFISCFTQ
jgi:hypothetical protein